MKVRHQLTLAAALCLLFVFVFAPFTLAAEYVIQGRNSETTLPLSGLYPGARSTNCWEFAQTVYKAVWGVPFTGERGTDDDLLRNIPKGAERAITTENTRNYISEARLGAVIRISTYIDGDDNNGRYKHSMILIDKDDDGFTVYEGSVNGRVRIKSYTWSEFANGYFGYHYGYYKYIKWPGANAYGEPQTLAMAACPATCVTLGDMNNDGAINLKDARMALRAAVELETFEETTHAFLVGDVDHDGQITLADARMILRAAVEIEDLR